MNDPNPAEDFSPERCSAENDADPEEQTVQVFLANEQATLTIDEPQVLSAVRAVVADSPYECGTISVAIVDDPTIHSLNVEFLQHDYPTDVLSFVLEDEPPRLEGELVVSADTAARCSEGYGWTAHDELLLYIIHGTLHLIGHTDTAADARSRMLAAEMEYLQKLQVKLPPGDARWSSDEPRQMGDERCEEGGSS